MPTIRPPKRRVLRSQPLAIIAAVVLVGVVAAYFAYLKLQQIQAEHDYQQIEKQAQQLDDHHLYDTEYAILQNYINAQPPQKYRYNVFIQLGTLAINKPNYAAALKWYQQAQAANNGKLGVDVAVGAAMAASGLGQKQTAIDYYRKAIALSDQSPDAPTDSGVENFKNSIQALGGTP